MPQTATKTLIYVVPEAFAFSGNDDTFYSDNSNSEILALATLDQYGSDKDQAGYDCYHIASNVGIPIDRLTGVIESLESHNMWEKANALNILEQGFVYDSKDETYTVWEDLDPEFQAEITANGGSYFWEDENGSDYMVFYSSADITQEWIDYLKEVRVKYSELY